MIRKQTIQTPRQTQIRKHVHTQERCTYKNTHTSEQASHIKNKKKKEKSPLPLSYRYPR